MAATRNLEEMGAKIGALLKARQERVVVAESSAGGLISAALLAVPGASAYYVAGGVFYTGRALSALLGISRSDIQAQGLRSSSEPYAAFLAQRMREKHGVEWAIAESGAAGPTGNPYGDPAGHTCVGVSGAVQRTRMLRTGSDDRVANMWAFADAGLALLLEALESSPR